MYIAEGEHVYYCHPDETGERELFFNRTSDERLQQNAGRSGPRHCTHAGI